MVVVELGRRAAMQGLVAGAAALAAPVRAGRFDPAAPGERLRTFMLLRGALDQRLVTSWVSARYYAVFEDRMEPLFGVVSAVFARYRPLAGGAVEAVNAELAWFTDPATGKVMDSFLNPLNGKTCKVPGGGFMPSKIRFDTDLSFHLAKPVPGMEMIHEVLPIEARGDDVWVTERSRTAFTPPGAAKPFRYSESNTFHARRSTLAPGATRAVSEVSFTNVCSWRPWLQMGDAPGHLMATGIGRHGAAMAELPPAWIEATQARRPDVLKDPGALLAPLWDAG